MGPSVKAVILLQFSDMLSCVTVSVHLETGRKTPARRPRGMIMLLECVFLYKCPSGGRSTYISTSSILIIHLQKSVIIKIKVRVVCEKEKKKCTDVCC